MRRLKIFTRVLIRSLPLLLLYSGYVARAANYPISAGASTATIQSTINTAAAASGGNTVTFAAGSYSITSQITVPCPASALTIQGPPAAYVPPVSVLPGTYSYTSPYTANLNGPVANNFAWIVGSNGCTTPITIQYFNWNGGQPGAGGGNWIDVVAGESNATITHNYAHGNWASTATSHDYDDTIALEGVGFAQFPVNSGITITWNVFGDGTSDCNPIMNLVNYQGGVYNSTGGYCGAVGVHASTTNIVIQNNDFEHLEQPLKFFEGSGNAGDITHTFMVNNASVMFNDFGQWHRIGIEQQQDVVANNTTGSVFNFNNNSMHDPIDPQYGLFGASLPACCAGYSGYTGTGGTDNQTNCNSNTMVDNVLSPTFTGYAFEWWSTGSCSYNLMQGHWNEDNGSPSGSTAGGVGWGDTSNTTRLWTASFNTAQFLYTTGQAVVREVEHTDIPPTQTANITSYTFSPTTSVSPSISPASGSYSSPLTVTLTDPGYTSGSVPQGNTSIYYTTDGSTPNPSGLTAPIGCAGVGNVCTPVTQPAALLSIASYGASPSASAATNTTALQNCNSAANAAATSCFIPAGNYTHNALTWTGPAGLYGAGSSSILTGSSDTTCQMTMAGNGWTISNYKSICPNGARDSTHWNFFIGRNVSSFRVDTMEVQGGDAGGFINFFSNHGIFTNNYVHDTLADCIYTTDGSNNMTVANNKARNCGDDSISNVSYTGDADGIVSNNLDENNDVGFQSNGRGITVVGGQNITIQGNLVQSTTQNACIYLADEPSFNSRAVSNIVVRNNTLNTCSGSTGQAALLLYAGQGTVSNVLAQGNSINNSVHDGMETQSLGGVTSDVAFIGNAIVTPGGSAITNANSGTSTGNVYCSGNTLGGSPVAGGACGGTNSFSPTGATLGGNTTQLYTLPIIVSLPTTIKTIGMWGAPNQPTSYPAGYGFVPSAVVTANYVASGGVTLSSVSIAPTAGQTTLLLGGTVQMIVTCHYSDGSTQGCNTTDSYGNSVTSWVSSNGNVTVSSSGLATGAAIGTANISATVTGGFITSPATTLTISANPATLSSVSLATSGAVSSIMVGTTNQLIATCKYSDGSSALCNTTDSHGNAVTSANSSVPSVATITSPGALATGVAAGSTNLSATVIPAPAQLGTNLQNVSGFTNNGAINEIYGVTGTSAGNYTPGNCHIIIPATTWVAGTLWTCLLALGTPTTQNASALCSNSYTTTGTSWPGGDLIISMASCPVLPPDQGYWVGSTTNQTTANPAQGFSNCNSSCSGAPPVYGSGTYAYRYVVNTFGNYTNLQTTLTPSAGTQQVSQYIELTTTPVASATLPLSITMPPPSLGSAYLTASSSSMTVGNTMQMAAKCHYTSGPDQDCTVADIYGDAVSAWVSSDPTKATVNNVGTSNPGLVTAVAAGTPSMTAKIGSLTSSAYPITVNNPPVTLTGVSLSLTGGVTVLFVGATNQLKATCTYSDGSSDDCTTTDVHGNLAHNYLSTSPAHATVNATSGLVTGVTLGTTTFTAVAGSFTSNALPLNVFPVLSGIYVITVGGPVKFSGTARF